MESLKAKLTGEVVYMYAFDVAYEIKRQGMYTLLGEPVTQFVVDSSKRNPRQIFFYRPLMVRLPAREKSGPHGPLRLAFTAKILPMGAMSITARVPFEVDRIEDLTAYHDLSFQEGTLHEEVLELAESLRKELLPFGVRVVDRLADEEAYTVFCISTDSSLGKEPLSEQWWPQNRRQVASLLTQEYDVEHLSDQEADESTGLYLSYYERDLLVLDWDSALLKVEAKNGSVIRFWT